MSRILEWVSWLLIFPYGYGAVLLAVLVVDSPRTPLPAAVIFVVYLAVYPLAAIVCNIMTRILRRAGRKSRALAVSFVPYSILAAEYFCFSSFVGLLVRLFD